MGKGRSGQLGVGHNLCLVNKPKKKGESVTQPRPGTESRSVPCESGGAPRWPHWIWYCRLHGPEGISTAILQSHLAHLPPPVSALKHG